MEQVHRGEFSYQVGRGGGKTIILVVEVEQAQQVLHLIRENGGGYHNGYHQDDGHENSSNDDDNYTKLVQRQHQLLVLGARAYLIIICRECDSIHATTQNNIITLGSSLCQI